MFDLISSAHAVATTVTATAKVTAGGTTVAAANAPWWDMPDSLATLLGSFGGAFLGLFAILLGALYNARLNRKRDDYNAQLNRDREDRVREQDKRALASALKAELVTVRQAAAHQQEAVLSEKLPDEERHFFLNPPPSFLRHPTVGVFPNALSRIELLDRTTIETVISAYATFEEIDENRRKYFSQLREMDEEKGTRGDYARQVLLTAYGHTMAFADIAIARLEKIERGEDPDTAVVPNAQTKEEEPENG